MGKTKKDKKKDKSIKKLLKRVEKAERVRVRPLHPLLVAAASGELPGWTVAGKGRRAHMGRVAALLSEWAQERGEEPREVLRWAATGWLHDALREADPERLRPLVDSDFRKLPGNILHGPAAAERLAVEGIEDEELLEAVAYHTLGHPDLGTLGKMLYAADSLEPGRRARPKWRARLRDRMPHDLNGVVRDIVGTRIRLLLKKGREVPVETVRFWNRMVEAAGE